MDKPRSENPGHIRRLFIRNFRGVKKSDWIPLRPLTFLVGPNSSGKSSVVDPLMLLAQSQLVDLTPTGRKPRWSGGLVDLGSYEDTVFGHNPNLKIEIGFEVSPDLVGVWGRRPSRPSLAPLRVVITLSAKRDDPIGRVIRTRVTDCLTDCSAEVTYQPQLTVSMRGRAFRWNSDEGKQPWQLREWLAESIESDLEAVPAEKGEGAAWNRIRDFLVSPSILMFLQESQRVSSGRSAPHRWYATTEAVQYFPMEPRLFDAIDPTMISQIGRDDHLYPMAYSGTKYRRSRPKLKEVLEELQIASEIEDHNLSAYHRAIRVKDSVTGIRSSLIDVGYGASQVIPVIHGCLSAASGPLFVEQPEIHLHPKAQGVIARLLTSTSKRRQVFVETHSVHMINRARVMVLEGHISHEDLIVLYVDRDKRGTHVTPIPIDEDANFSQPWPKGFFDERYQDTLRLLELKSEREEA